MALGDPPRGGGLGPGISIKSSRRSKGLVRGLSKDKRAASFDHPILAAVLATPSVLETMEST